MTTKPTAKRKPGRPSSRRLALTPALKARICRDLALGKSLRRVLKGKGMPTMSRVMETLQGDKAWQEQYARGRARGIELHIDGIVDLADSATPENANAVRLKVDVRKWLASKLVPKVYGDRVDLTGDVRVSEPADIREIARGLAYILTSGAKAADQTAPPHTHPQLPALPAPHLSAEHRRENAEPETPTHNSTPAARPKREPVTIEAQIAKQAGLDPEDEHGVLSLAAEAMAQRGEGEQRVPDRSQIIPYRRRR